MPDPARPTAETASQSTSIPVTKSAEDLVDRVRDERSLIKLINLAVPGFRGYRQREDIRQADALLRAHAAREIEAGLSALKAAREKVSRRLDLESMGPLAEAIAQLEGALLEIRHAEQGYADSRSALRVTDEELLRLYEIEARIVELSAKVRDAYARLPTDGALTAALESAGETVQAFRASVADRRKNTLRLE